MMAQDWFNRGNDLRNTDKQAAINAYTEAIRLEPSLDVAYFNRALTYSELGRDKEAVADSKVLADRNSECAGRLRTLFGTLPGAYVSLGNHAFKAGDFRLALEKYDAALIYDPKCADAHVGRGVIFGQQGKIPEAISEYNRAIALDARSAVAYHNRGEAYLAQSQFREAVADFTKAIELDPGEPSGYTKRAEAFKGLHDKVRAKKDREMASRLEGKRK